MSTIVGNIVIKVQDEHPEIPAEQIARCLAVISGVVLLFIGLIRAGWIVEFISLTAITSFMTGAAISIGVGQVPTLMGIPKVSNREATYKVIINTLKGLPNTRLDAAIGLSALTMLYGIRIFCSVMSNKQPRRKKMWFFISTLRMAFVILLYILISYLVNRGIKDPKKAHFKILGKVPRGMYLKIFLLQSLSSSSFRLLDIYAASLSLPDMVTGFQHAGAPVMNTELLSIIAPDIPVTIIVLILEHMAISKSFGRINNYTINPSQELVAVGKFIGCACLGKAILTHTLPGFTNVLGPFLGGYPATGSFSRTAIKSKAGVRTPLAGIFTAVIVLLALYALTSMFFYIPSAGLAAVIIHAVGDLITPPNVIYQFWETSPLEVVIFFGGVLLTVFTNIENGIYLTMCASLALMLWRHLKSHGVFLGKVTIYRATPDTIGRNGEPDKKSSREAYLPVNHHDGSNPALKFEQPYPGVFVYRFSEGFTYLNQQHYLDAVVEHVQAVSRPTKLDRYAKIGDRPWNDPGPRRGQQINLEDDRPILRAIILDFSSVNHVDVTSIQGLVDVRNQLDRYAAPEIVEWHFASISSRWTKRALTSAGFGYISTERVRALQHWTPAYSFAAVDDDATAKPKTEDLESAEIEAADAQRNRFPTKVTTVHGQNRPYFHIDVPAAVESAIAAIENRLAHTTHSSSDVYEQTTKQE